MEEKQARHSALIKLLGTKDLESQEEVVHEMTKLGFDVTQSSISRDFRELKIIKAGGVYKPIASFGKYSAESPFQRMITGIDTAGPHLVVVKTSSGAAAAVAEEIDADSMEDIVGTVAGDNTIFIASRSSAGQSKIIAKIRSI